MTVVTLRPSSTVAATGTVTGAASADVALRDNSDASYITGINAERYFIVAMEDTSIPAGGVVKRATLRLRTALSSGSSAAARFFMENMTPSEGLGFGVSWTEIITTTQGIIERETLTNGVINASSLWFTSEVTLPLSETIRVYEAYLDVMYVRLPTITLSRPAERTELTSTNRVTATWTNTYDADGGGQTNYDVRIYRGEALTEEGAFEPSRNPGTAPAESRQVASGATTFVSDPLTNGNYRMFVRTAQTVLGRQVWSEYRNVRFTVNVIVPQTPGVTFTEERAFARGRIDIETRMRRNLVPNPKGRERSVLSWASLEVTTFVARNMGEEEVPATGGGIPAEIGSAFKIVGRASGSRAQVQLRLVRGRTYTASMWVYIQELSTATEIDLAIGNPGAVLIRTSVLRTRGAWTRLSVTFTTESEEIWTIRTQQIGAGAARWFATGVLIEEQTERLGEYVDGDTRGFQWVGRENNSASSTLTISEIQVARSTDEGTTWEPLRTNLGDGFTTVIEGQATTWDYEGANEQVITYRARVYHTYAAELTAASEWVTVRGSWSSTDRWLKHPTEPALNMKVDIYSYSESTKTSRQGVFQPLGSRSVVIVSDTPTSEAGSLILWITKEERDALDALFESGSPLLLQMLPTDGQPDRWLIFGSRQRTSAVDKLGVSDSMDTLPWTEVSRP